MSGDKNISLEWVEMWILCVQQTYEILYCFMENINAFVIFLKVFVRIRLLCDTSLERFTNDMIFLHKGKIHMLRFLLRLRPNWLPDKVDQLSNFDSHSSQIGLAFTPVKFFCCFFTLPSKTKRVHKRGFEK